MCQNLNTTENCCTHKFHFKQLGVSIKYLFLKQFEQVSGLKEINNSYFWFCEMSLRTKI